MMGDVAVLSPRGGPAEEAAAAAELLRRPGVRSVAALLGADGRRGAGARHVAGDPSLEIVYKEFGLHFRLDLSRHLSRLSRSQGGVDERQRLRGLVQPGERILVLCSRFGLTSCMLGRHTACEEVVGVEPNAVLHESALANIELNRLAGRVSSMLRDPGDLSDLGRFDRVCAFLPFRRDGVRLALDELVAEAVAATAPGGTLHAYVHESEEEFSAGSRASLLEMARGCAPRGAELLWRGKVPRKSIGRNQYRVGLDFRLG